MDFKNSFTLLVVSRTTPFFVANIFVHDCSHNERKVSHQKRYLIPLSFDDKENSFQDQGYAITHNPPGDGNCQF